MEERNLSLQLERHLKISRTANFGCEILLNTENMRFQKLQILYIFARTEKSYPLTTNFRLSPVVKLFRTWYTCNSYTRRIFSYFALFRSQIWQFYHLEDALSGGGDWSTSISAHYFYCMVCYSFSNACFFEKRNPISTGHFKSIGTREFVTAVMQTGSNRLTAARLIFIGMK